MTQDRRLYRFQSTWVLGAVIDDVFEVLVHPGEARVPNILESKVTATGRANGVGRTAVYRVRSPLLYSLQFEAVIVDVEAPTMLRSEVSGDLEGAGTYRLSSQPDGTRVDFGWVVRTTKRWMNVLAPVARPVFAWAHYRVMRTLVEVMAAELEAEIKSFDSQLVD